MTLIFIFSSAHMVKKFELEIPTPPLRISLPLHITHTSMYFCTYTRTHYTPHECVRKHGSFVTARTFGNESHTACVRQSKSNQAQKFGRKYVHVISIQNIDTSTHQSNTSDTEDHLLLPITRVNTRTITSENVTTNYPNFTIDVASTLLIYLSTALISMVRNGFVMRAGIDRTKEREIMIRESRCVWLLITLPRHTVQHTTHTSVYISVWCHRTILKLC